MGRAGDREHSQQEGPKGLEEAGVFTSSQPEIFMGSEEREGSPEQSVCREAELGSIN